MQINIPIKQVKSEDVDDGGVWDLLCDLREFPALDFWGRRAHALCHPRNLANIPPAVLLGHGDMHLDYWLEPDQLIGVLAAADIGLIGRPVVQHEGKAPVFEVKVNVSDYKAKELKVKVGKDDRLLTIEGKHEEQKDDGDEDADADAHHHGLYHFDSLYATFQRSVTLPKNVLERQMKCTLTRDGTELVVRAPARPTSRMTRCHGVSQSRAHNNQCACMIAE